MIEEEICCPKFDPNPWDEKIHEWNNKKFVKGKVRTFFYIPVSFGAVMKRFDKQIKDADAIIQDGMGLSNHTSKWNMDVYLAVDKEIPSLENIALNGKFLSKVYEGPFKDTSKWCKDFEQYAKSKSVNILKWYMWYTTCPKCAKKYGKNYVVIIAQVN
jgi:hypothetical protein